MLYKALCLDCRYVASFSTESAFNNAHAGLTRCNCGCEVCAAEISALETQPEFLCPLCASTLAGDKYEQPEEMCPTCGGHTIRHRLTR